LSLLSGVASSSALSSPRYACALFEQIQLLTDMVSLQMRESVPTKNPVGIQKIEVTAVERTALVICCVNRPTPQKDFPRFNSTTCSLSRPRETRIYKLRMDRTSVRGLAFGLNSVICRNNAPAVAVTDRERLASRISGRRGRKRRNCQAN
jgi:hypothetical protein